MLLLLSGNAARTIGALQHEQTDFHVRVDVYQAGNHKDRGMRCLQQRLDDLESQQMQPTLILTQEILSIAQPL